jgi:hypothetical protein
MTTAELNDMLEMLLDEQHQIELGIDDNGQRDVVQRVMRLINAYDILRSKQALAEPEGVTLTVEQAESVEWAVRKLLAWHDWNIGNIKVLTDAHNVLINQLAKLKGEQE